MGKDGKGFLHTLKRIKWDIEGKRFLYLQTCVSWIPGLPGQMIRSRLIGSWFGSIGDKTIILHGTYLRNPEKISVGKHCDIGIGVQIQAAGGLTMGDYVILGPGVRIWTANHIYKDPDIPIYDQGTELKPVVIESDTWIGAGAFVMPGAHLERGCVVSALSVVGGKRYKAYSILAGNPARVIGFRNAKSPAREVSPPGSARPEAAVRADGDDRKREDRGPR